jgi:L-2,4-diaminobutyrate decarboxylase
MSNTYQSEFLTSRKTSQQSYQQLISQAVQAVCDSFPDQPFSGKNAEELASLVEADFLPEAGCSEGQVFEKLHLVVANSVIASHPHTAAHLHCPPLTAALAAEIVLSALNQSMDSFDQAPMATVVEQKLIRWLCEQAGFPAAAEGTFTTGGSQSNYMGLLLARDKVLKDRWNWSAQKSGLPPEAHRLRILCSEVAHFTVEKSAAQIGLGTDSVLRVPVDAEFRMQPDLLRRELSRLRERDLVPMAIVGTAGTTDFGSIDPLPELASAAREAGAWFHVDAAYGGALLFSPRHRRKLAGIGTADSIAIDFHKLFWQPIPCSAFLLRERRNFDFIKMHADYLNPETLEEEGVPNLVATSLLTTRRFDALKLWLSFQWLGRAKLAAMIDRTIELADHAAAMVKQEPALELVCAPQLSTVVFRYIPSDRGLDADRINFAIRQRLFDEGKAVVGHTRVGGRQCLKFTCLNPMTTVTQFEELLGLIREQGRECETMAR